MGLSPDGYMTRINGSGRYVADRPLSVNTARNGIANTLHLIDQYCQHRITWSVTDTDDVLFFSPGGGSNVTEVTVDEPFLMYSQELIWTIRHDGTPAVPVIRVRARASGAVLDVAVSLMPANVPRTLSVTPGQNVWLAAEGSVDNTEGSVVGGFRDPNTAGDRALVDRSLLKFPTEDGDGNTAQAAVLLVRLDIWGQLDASESSAGLTGIWLREFSG